MEPTREGLKIHFPRYHRRIRRRMPCRVPAPPNDPLYSQQTYLNAANVPQAWQVTTGSSSQKIAVIAMGGINKNHEDSNARVTIKTSAASPFANNGAADPEAGIMGGGHQ